MHAPCGDCHVHNVSGLDRDKRPMGLLVSVVLTVVVSSGQRPDLVHGHSMPDVLHHWWPYPRNSYGRPSRLGR
eukprot:3673801-Prorocentrum_lima.AAC.1